MFYAVERLGFGDIDVITSGVSFELMFCLACRQAGIGVELRLKRANLLYAIGACYYLVCC